MNSSTCTIDTQCPFPLVCFNSAIAKWLPSNTSYCACPSSPYATIQGDLTCTTTHPSYGVDMFLLVLLLCSSLVFSFVAVYDMFDQWRIWQFSFRSDTTQTLLLIGIFGVSAFIEYSFAIFCAASPRSIQEFYGYRTCSLTYESVAFAIFTVLVGYCATVNVALVFLRVAWQTQKMTPHTGEVKTSWTRILVMVLEFTYALSLTGCLVALRLDVAMLVTLPFALVGIILYLVGGFRLSVLLGQALNTAMTQQQQLSAWQGGGGGGAGGSRNMESSMPGGPDVRSSPPPMQLSRAERRHAEMTARYTGVAPLQRAIKRVRATMFIVAILGTGVIVCVIISAYYLTISGADTYEPGGWNRPGYFATRSSQILGQLTLASVLVYLHWNVRGAVQKFKDQNAEHQESKERSKSDMDSGA